MTKQTKIFVKLVEELINDVITLYAHDAEKFETYSFGWIDLDEELGLFAIGSNNRSEFHFADEVVKIAEACGMSWYIDIGENLIGKPCATVRVF